MLAGGQLPSISERLLVMTEHLEHMHQFYGLQQGVRIARKHIQAYLQNLAVTQLIPSFMTLESAFEQLTWLRRSQSRRFRSATNSFALACCGRKYCLLGKKVMPLRFVGH